VPLEVRSVTSGAFITSMTLSFGGRLDSNVMGLMYVAQSGHKNWICPEGAQGFGDKLYNTIGEKHPVEDAPEAGTFLRAKMVDSALTPGTDLTPSLIMTVDIGTTPGTFEIDTTCVAVANHLVYVADVPPGVQRWPIIPAFTKGVITVVPCDCSHHGDLNGDSAYDVLDMTFLIDWVFSGTQQPPTDQTCPHIDRGDVNCDGVDDVFDVVYLNDFLFSNGPAPCNPCACSPYPTSCP
jgi:hypothetical protein